MTHEVSVRERRLTVIALGVVLSLSAMDQFVVMTAMPRIIADLQGLSMYAWTTTAYMLTSTVLVPIYGKLSDLHGRKPILVLGVVLFLTGSALCGLAGEFGNLPLLGSGMTQLIVFRAVQATGGAALSTCTFAIIADLYPPRERGRLMGLFGSVFGVASIVGPLLGGFFADHGEFTVFGHQVAGWRGVFYVNLPIGIVALFMILTRMPQLTQRREGRIDLPGATLIVMTFVPLLLALSMGGRAFAWDSALITGCFAAAALGLALFIWVESRTPHAIMPLSLFRNPVFVSANLAALVLNVAFLGMMMFLPLFMQVVQGVSATSSGLAFIPMMVGVIASSVIGGRIVTRLGRYKAVMLAAGVILVLGCTLIWRVGPDTTRLDLAWRMLVLGCGLGPAQGLYSLAVQNSVPVTQIGIGTSSGQFFRQIGSTIGIAVFGTLLTHNLARELPLHVPQIAGVDHHSDLASVQPGALNASVLDESLHEAIARRRALGELAAAGDEKAAALVRGVTEGFSAVIAQLFGLVILTALLGLLITATIPQLPLRSRTAPAVKPEAAVAVHGRMTENPQSDAARTG